MPDPNADAKVMRHNDLIRLIPTSALRERAAVVDVLLDPANRPAVLAALGLREETYRDWETDMGPEGEVNYRQRRFVSDWEAEG